MGIEEYTKEAGTTGKAIFSVDIYRRQDEIGTRKDQMEVVEVFTKQQFDLHSSHDICIQRDFLYLCFL